MLVTWGPRAGKESRDDEEGKGGTEIMVHGGWGGEGRINKGNVVTKKKQIE